MINLDKYLYKYRLIIIITPSYADIRYINTKKILLKKINKIEMERRYTKFLFYQNSNKNFTVYLIGFDGNIKKIYNQFNQFILNDIFNKIDKMPMGSYKKF
jgi:3-isopropylmalate dehydratase small subunit